MNIAICDDEKIIMERLSVYIRNAAAKYGRDCNIQTFDSGEELLSACKSSVFDAVFLDIAMPYPDGFETAKRLMVLKPDVNLIFVSNKESMVFSSYEYNPLWFVPKSQICFLETAMHKIISKIEKEELENRLVSVKIEKNKVTEIDIKKTSYIKSEAHYLRIFTVDKEYSESYRNNLDNIENQLSKYSFVRCHHRYLVNCKNISAIQNSYCILLNGERIPVSRNKMAATKECFQNYLRSM